MEKSKEIRFFGSFEVQPPVEETLLESFEDFQPWRCDGRTIYLPEQLKEEEADILYLQKLLEQIVENLPKHTFLGKVGWVNETDTLDQGYFEIEKKRSRVRLYVAYLDFRPLNEFV